MVIFVVGVMVVVMAGQQQGKGNVWPDEGSLNKWTSKDVFSRPGPRAFTGLPVKLFKQNHGSVKT